MSTYIVLMVLICSMAMISDGFTDFNPATDLDGHLVTHLSPFNHNETNCGGLSSCGFLDEFGPPPDGIAFMPPPPIPPFLQAILSENESLRDDDVGCNLCHLFHDPSQLNNEFILPKPEVKTSDSWVSLVVLSVLGSTVVGGLLLVLLFKCKKWKIFPVTDSCPILPESFLGGHKTAPPPCSPTDSCISPVVNEKSPQSVITDAPSKKTSISCKYWRRGADINEEDGRQVNLHHTTDIDDQYGSCADGASCTSSPVYAELDASGVSVSTPIGQMLLNGSQSISPYAVHTYSEVTDAVRMASLGSSSALLPDASYDNAAYLPSSNSDYYHNRSLRRHRTATLGHLGSATPLLSNHLINGSPNINYLAGGRPHKKPRPHHTQHLSRHNLIRMQDDLQSMERSVFHDQIRRNQGLYADLPLNSPALSTFRAPYALRDPNKRPLPPVPGVRL